MSIVSPRVRRSIGTSRPYGMIQKKLQFNEDTNGLSGITEDEKFEEFQSPEDAEELVTRMIEVRFHFILRRLVMIVS